jgi:hypothetical protein
VPVYLIDRWFSLRLRIDSKISNAWEIYDGNHRHRYNAGDIKCGKQIGEQTILDGNQSEIDNYFKYLYEEYDNASENKTQLN